MIKTLDVDSRFISRVSKISYFNLRSCRIIGLALLLLLLVNTGAALAEELNVCRELPVSANPGDTITVILDITLDGADKTVIEENAPRGWTVSNPSDDGSIFNANTVNWIYINSAPGAAQFTYDVTIPEDAAPGTYTFDGDFDLAVAAPGIQPIDCETQMDVEDATSTIDEKTEVSNSGGSSSSGSSNGGSGASGEAFENIGFKDVKMENIIGGAVISYTFDEEQNAIDYIKFTALKNYGEVSTTVEVLKNRSAMVNESAPGLVYSNLNIWVGKVGFATEDNIAHPVIGFSVSKAWLTENEINENAIALYRHSKGKWNNLNTIKIGEDDSYIYFEAETPGFSPFAISANTEEDDTSIAKDSEPKYAGSDAEAETPIEDEAASEPNNTPGISGILSVMLLGCAYVFSKRKN
ncbi:PGF-pre-PGF domain-containing protein [Methanococcoides alaskense]|uniref:PGF-pre-PGF domain-containing protein n=1 Tax=Methanococcoides alaskense TaxID=325778 RepID=A0AA90TXE1_9EURY|nr:PGF-pre-PGF domain-containing protein [Methanococcoides alaskense]MDA0525298.1 PGF-pre-PGF domain-containing protein [Methanococcoides alaskense]MDR6221778.1 PGF-pre-PGF domain-containing protein [Methanococcoides alaskense]